MMQIENGTPVTKQLLRSWDACWADDRVAAYFGARTEIALETVLRDKTITIDDRLWVGTKYLAAVDDSAARKFAIEIALSVVAFAGDEDDQALFRGIMNDLIAAEDLPPAQRDAAWDAARDAAQDAARDAARAAAWDAARDAAWAAAWDAAWDAARDAAWAAAQDAARAAARDAAQDAAQDAARAARAAKLEECLDRILAWLTPYPIHL